MPTYQITGAIPLCGQVPIGGAKNAALPILAASVLCADQSRLHCCPNISDVSNALKILKSLGCKVQLREDCVVVDTYPANRCEIAPNLMATMRAAVIFLGALLARFGEARITQPGGCPLGERPIDLHLLGLRHMGYRCEYEGNVLCCKEEALRGCTIALPFPSVGATENILLAALRCDQEIVLCNAAREPEIADLICYLKKCGAQISGANTSVLRIRGGRRLHGATHTVMPDRMEAATYLCAAAITRGSVELLSSQPRHLTAVLESLKKAGCCVRVSEDRIWLSCKHLHSCGSIRTAPYDAFPTDAQAPMMAAMATGEGSTVFEENIFSDRFRHVPALRSFGADIYAADRYAVVKGVGRLHAANVAATDLRGGAAMVLAALNAEGTSSISNIAHIQRGYESFVQKLSSLGAQIKITE